MSPPDVDVTNSADGTLLAYEVHGDGPPLVYVTGAICHRRFGPVRSGTKVLAGAFRVLSYDRRGRGDSSEASAWSLGREVDDIAALIDVLGGRAFLYGHSSGAVLALHAAHRLGDRVRGTVLYDPSWAAGEAEAAGYADLRADVDALLSDGRHRRALQRFLVGIGMPRAFAALLPVMPGWRRMRALAPTLRHDMALTAEPPPLEVAAAVPGPVHVVVGEKSPESLHRVALALAAAVPESTLEVLPGQDHMVSERVLLPSLVRALRAADASERRTDGGRRQA